MHNMQSVLLRENPLRGVSPRLGENRNRSRNLTILTPDVPLTPIPTGVAGPLPEDFGRFVLGCSSLSFKKKIKQKKKKERKEISLVHGVVDSDDIEKLKS